MKVEFKPRRWEQLGRQAIGSGERVAEKAGRGPILPEAFVNRYYPIRLQRRPQVWKGLGSGEIFRIGNGWSWPEPEGCRILPGGGMLRFRIVRKSVVEGKSVLVREDAGCRRSTKKKNI